MKTSIVAFGIEQAIQKSVRTSEKSAQAFLAAMVHEAEKIMTQSKLQVPVSGYVPKSGGPGQKPTKIKGGPQGGALRDSSFVEHKTSGKDMISTLGYRSEYAIFVHEIGPDRVHHPHGKWRYLRDPLEAATPGMQGRVADAVSKVIPG